VNTVTSSFIAVYDTVPTCVGALGTAGVITNFIQGHSYVYAVDPSIFSAGTGDNFKLTYSLDTTAMVPAAFTAPDSVVLNANTSFTIKSNVTYTGL
jgi:hypothetical protein